mgnify:CR=1 FL=1
MLIYALYISILYKHIVLYKTNMSMTINKSNMPIKHIIDGKRKIKIVNDTVHKINSKSVPNLGGINKTTLKYTLARLADKKNKYKCPDCNKDIILKKGTIKAHHFAHYKDDVHPCNYYSKPSESQIHKDGKMLMKSILEEQRSVSMFRKCTGCNKRINLKRSCRITPSEPWILNTSLNIMD